MPHKPTLNEHAIYRRHMQLQPFQGCWEVEILYQLVKTITRIQKGVAMIHKLVHAICKEFLALLLKPPCHSLLHIISQYEYVQPPKPNGPKTLQSHGNRSRAYAGYLNCLQSWCIPVGPMYPVGYTLAGIAMKRDDAICDFTDTRAWSWNQLLEHLSFNSSQ
jgi:hypothetical protein